jgi:hypothetical protein
MQQTDFIEKVEQAVKVINKTAADDELLRFVVEEVVDRALIYLNYGGSDKIDERLVKIVARIASGIFNQTNANVNSTGAEMAVSSMSDNGQSISYADKTKNYLASAEDGELFGGFAKLLAPYRRINVVP